MAVSAASYEALSVVEVMLRNAIDEELRAWNGTQDRSDGSGPCSSDWLIDPSHLLERLSGVDIRKAEERCASLRIDNPSHDDLLAQTSFGTWRYLLWSGDVGTQYLWNGLLKNAFPHCRDTPGAFSGRVQRVYQFRNRVAHLEPMLNSNSVAARLTDMEQILAAIDPAAEAWFTGLQRVTGVLSRRPS